MTPVGELFAGGWFTTAGGEVSAHLARAATSCPAKAQPVGSACSSTVGPMDLDVEALPWIGGGFRTRCTGFAATGVGLGLLGFASLGTPLAQLHPAGAAGCDLLADDDAVLLLLPAAGAVRCAFPMPTDPAFAGFVLQHQILQLELAAGGQLARIAGSRGVTLTLGAF